MKETVYVVDSMNYIFRAYHGLPDNITSPSGMLTNAVLGYLRTLLRLIKERKPKFLVSVFEGDTSFRNALFSDYKATRTATPVDLKPQFEYCQKISEAIGVPCFEHSEYEADDIIGTIALRMAEAGHQVVVVTGDKDMSQLVRPGIQVYDLAKEIWLDEAGVHEKFGVTPAQIPEYLSLLGDSVDNIPGVFGVGEKTARQILAACSSVEDLIGAPHLDSQFTFRGRVDILKRIRDNIETVRLSRKLATICCDAPVLVNADTVRYRRGNLSLLGPLCEELGFHRVLDDIPIAVAQPTLF
jgi:DNA polymerase-1